MRTRCLEPSIANDVITTCNVPGQRDLSDSLTYPFVYIVKVNIFPVSRQQYLYRLYINYQLDTLIIIYS